MFFLWDVMFGTAHISRQYPVTYGISHYQRDQWYAQFLWPVFKSKVADSELGAYGPMVREDVQQDIGPHTDLPEIAPEAFPTGLTA